MDGAFKLRNTSLLNKKGTACRCRLYHQYHNQKMCSDFAEEKKPGGFDYPGPVKMSKFRPIDHLLFLSFNYTII